MAPHEKLERLVTYLMDQNQTFMLEFSPMGVAARPE